MLEVWEIIKEYPNYEVSSLGRVRNLNGAIKKFFISDQGYYKVQLYSNNKKRNVRVHRLVASAFLNKTLGKDQVNHKDLNKLNNVLENLEWVSQEENVSHYLVINSKYSSG